MCHCDCEVLLNIFNILVNDEDAKVENNKKTQIAFYKYAAFPEKKLP